MNLSQTPIEQTACQCGATRYWREFHTGYSYARHWTNANGLIQWPTNKACPECGDLSGVTEMLAYNAIDWMATK